MNASPRLSVLLLVVAGAAAGCAAPAPLVRLEPRTANDVVWVSGRAVLEKEKGGVRVAAAFERQQGAGLGVRVEVQNGTSASFEVTPDGVTFMSCPDPVNTSCSGSWGVVDPEQVLAGLDEQQSRTQAQATNAQVLATSLVFLSAVTDVASVASGHADRATGLRTVALADDAESTEASANQALASIADQRELWSNVALRRTTIAPGHGVSGLVFLPVDLKARYIWIHVRAGGEIFPFGFKQDVRQVAAYEARAPH